MSSNIEAEEFGFLLKKRKKIPTLFSQKFIKQANLDANISGICYILRRPNCEGALHFVSLAEINELPSALLRQAFAGQL